MKIIFSALRLFLILSGIGFILLAGYSWVRMIGDFFGWQVRSSDGDAFLFAGTLGLFLGILLLGLGLASITKEETKTI